MSNTNTAVVSSVDPAITEGFNIGSQLSPEQIAAIENATATVNPESVAGGSEETPPVASASAYIRDVNRVVEQSTSLVHAPENTEDDNLPETQVDVTLAHIIDSYKPTKSYIDAAADAREAIRGAHNTIRELDASFFSRLCFDMADILLACLQKGTLKLYNPSDHNKMNPVLAKELVAHIKSENLFGESEEVKDTTDLTARESLNPENPVVRIMTAVEKTSPLTGTIGMYINDAAMYACLLVHYKETRVEVGYSHKGDDATSGRRWNKNDIFLRLDQLTESVENYWRVICVPTNVLHPWIYAVQQHGENKFVLIPGKPHESTTLRRLTKEHCYALYQHFYADMELEYDLGPSEKPTGLLLKEKKASRTPAAPGSANGETKPKTLDEANTLIKRRDAEIANIRKEKLEAVIDLTKGGDTKLFDALADSIADMKNIKVVPSNMLAAIAHVFRNAVQCRISQYRGQALPINVAREIIPVMRELQSNMAWDDDAAEWLWQDDNGKVWSRFVEDDGDVKIVA